MKKRFTSGLILTLSIMISCSNNPAAKIQGVYEVDKESLKTALQAEMGEKSSLAMGLFNIALENAVIEFCIKGDSINGILFMAGETTLIESEIIKRNDSLIIVTPELEAHIIQTKRGLSYTAIGSDMSLTLNKTDRIDLSSDTKKAIEAEKVTIKRKEEFQQNLGKWQEGNYVDEFGDNTGDGYAYCLIRGTSETSISTQNEVYVKAMLESEKLRFEIYNSSLSMKESFPDSKFGIMKLKFPDGKVESEQVFFYHNIVSESGDKAILHDYIVNKDGLVKVFIDLSTAGRYYTDKYQFAIGRRIRLYT